MLLSFGFIQQVYIHVMSFIKFGLQTIKQYITCDLIKDKCSVILVFS